MSKTNITNRWRDRSQKWELYSCQKNLTGTIYSSPQHFFEKYSQYQELFSLPFTVDLHRNTMALLAVSIRVEVGILQYVSWKSRCRTSLKKTQQPTCTRTRIASRALGLSSFTLLWIIFAIKLRHNDFILRLGVFILVYFPTFWKKKIACNDTLHMEQ